MNLFYYATLIALTILWEAPHQPAMGQELVAHTIVNRAELSGMDVEAVIMQRGQYAGWTPQRRMDFLRGAIEGELPWCMDPVGHLDRIPQEGWREATAGDWWRIWAMSLAVLLGKPEPEGFEGVTHFDNLAFWGGEDPPWAGEKECLGKVGDHVFYR
jgi:hypothetical protein